MFPAARFAPLLLLLMRLAIGPAWAQGTFDFSAVEAEAQKLAREPYKDVRPIGGEMKELGYDQYRALRTRPDSLPAASITTSYSPEGPPAPSASPAARW